VINSAFLALAITAGVTCPTVDVARVRQAVLATDLLLGRDECAQRYIKVYRQRQQQNDELFTPTGLFSLLCSKRRLQLQM